MAFQKGKSGNPGGRRQDKIATRELILALNEQDGDANKLRRVIDALIAKAKEGDVPAINAIMDRVEGKPLQFSTGDADEFRRAMDLSDDELASIAAGGSDGAASPESHPPVTH